jgi:hypothetical protein
MEAAATIEAKKHGLRQGQDGAWTLALVLHPNDVPNWLLTAPMGQRLAVVVAALEEEAPPPPEKPKERKRFEELPLSQQAALRCNDLAFQRWLAAGWPAGSVEEVPQKLREYCRVQSRAELDTDEKAAARWRDLDRRFLSETGRVTEQR